MAKGEWPVTLACNAAALTAVRCRRLKRLVISPDLILQLLIVGRNGIVVDGIRIVSESDAIPEQATAVRCGITDDGSIQMLIEDDSFDEAIEGLPVPILKPVYRAERET